MMCNLRLRALVIAAMTSAFHLTAFADESACARHIDRQNLVACAVQASLQVRAEQYGVSAVQGRKITANVLTGFNPVLAINAGAHTVDRGNGSSWSAAISQEFEIGGQRASRREAVTAQYAAQTSRVALAQRHAAAQAWLLYFDTVGAEQTVVLAGRLLKLTDSLAIAVQARADKGLLAPMEVDVVQATLLRRRQELLDLTTHLAIAQASLLLHLGLEAGEQPPVIAGELQPLTVQATDLASSATADRLDVLIAQKEVQVLQARLETLRRSTLPNVAVSLFAQQDAFDGRVLGLGLALPLPIAGWGRTYAGEIAETEALTQRATTETDVVKRRAQLAIKLAIVAYRARLQALQALPPEQIQRADRSLDAIAQQVQAGRLTVRDAIVTQQALIELLHMQLQARKGLCQASVELLHALDQPLERGLR